MQVRMITAPWCARCKEMKPDVINFCKVASVELSFVEHDDLEPEETEKISSLPTLQIRKGEEAWKDSQSFTAKEYELWKNALMGDISIKEMDF